jgi:pilus assembly protein Flp/PilA
MIARFILNTSGATSIEYGLIAGMISIFIVGALIAMQESIVGLYDGIAAAILSVP